MSLDEHGGWSGVLGRLTAGADLGAEARFDLSGAEGSAVLVWITDLGDGDPPRVRAAVAEISVFT